MKKFLSVVLALALMLMPVLSMAEAATELEYAQYTHTNEQYSFVYPNTWTVLNAETIEMLVNTLSESADEQLAQMVATYGPQIQQYDMVMVINETGMTNINVVCQPVGMEATEEALQSLAPAAVLELSNTMPGIEFLNEGTVTEFNGNKSLVLEYTYELSGMQMHGAQVYVAVGTNLYMFTYTCANADELVATSESLGVMLSSLEVK